MSLSTYEIEVFMTMFETKNLSRSAERLGLTQPALSMSLKRLESYFGVPLFLRTKHGLEPTKASLQFAKEARKLARDIEEIRERVSLRQRGFEGTYTLGFHPQVASYVFPKFATALLTKSEKLNFKLVFDNSRRILSDVIDYKIDFGIVVDPVRHPDLILAKLYDNTIRFWTREKSTELQAPGSPVSVVYCARSLLMMESLLAKAIRDRQWTSLRIIDTSDLDVIREFVSQGLGIGILPATIAQKNRHDRLSALSSFPSLSEQIYLVYRADLQKPQAAKFVRSVILAAFKKNVVAK